MTGLKIELTAKKGDSILFDYRTQWNDWCWNWFDLFVVRFCLIGYVRHMLVYMKEFFKSFSVQNKRQKICKSYIVNETTNASQANCIPFLLYCLELFKTAVFFHILSFHLFLMKSGLYS